ncbi:MAG: hypothetical protein MK066_08170 [Crocinitomicaceae bacterium]|nr:hypothetical protein [Crocinitomicaceae bacterium]
MGEYTSKTNQTDNRSSLKSKTIDQVVNSKYGKGSVYIHTITGRVQPVMDENNIFVRNTTEYTHTVTEIPNSVEGEGDLHLIQLPDGEILAYRVYGGQKKGLGGYLRTAMNFNPVFKISRASLGLIQKAIGNPPGPDNFNKDMNGKDISTGRQFLEISDGIITIATSPYQLVKLSYMGIKATVIGTKMSYDRFTLYSHLPSDIRTVISNNVFKPYFTLGTSVVELTNVE